MEQKSHKQLEATNFKVSENRDAWAVIRGFVYQVAVTIERWLNLENDQVLELERGEDIDIICSEYKKENPRILEQIKYRKSTVTLRKPEILCSLAQFYAHQNENPNLSIRFIYVTNSRIAHERPPICSDGCAGLRAWQEINSNGMAPQKRQEYLSSIRRYLKNTPKPESFSEKTWQIFKGFLESASDLDFQAFVQSVEWSTEMPGSRELVENIQKFLRRRYDLNHDQSEIVYSRLFMRVFYCLTKSGLKQLTARELENEIQATPLSDSDFKIFNKITNDYEDAWKLAHELGRHIEDLADFKRGIEELLLPITRLIENGGGQAIFNPMVYDILINAPAPVKPRCGRKSIVEEYKKTLESYTWLGLHGEILSGKSQLALLLMEAVGHPVAWVRFTNYNETQSSIILGQALAKTESMKSNIQWEIFVSKICKKLGKDSVIVLDDLPRILGKGDFSDRLVILANNCHSYGIKIVSSSCHEIPVFVSAKCEDGVLHQEKIPKFSQQETRELFQEFGASANVLDGSFINLVTILSKGHPAILYCLAKYMSSKNWELNQQEIENLIKGGYATSIEDVAQVVFEKTVPDQDARDLAYRLTLVSVPFGYNHVRIVSEIPPSIAHPHEKIQNLLRSWISQADEEKYEMSQLIKRAGDKNLESGLQKRIREALGFDVLRARQVSPLQIIEAFVYFLSAENYNMSAFTLLVALKSLFLRDEKVYDWGIADIWVDMPLPSQIDFPLRLIIRTLQIVIHKKRNRDVSNLLRDWDRLAKETSGEDHKWVFTNGILLAPIEPIMVNRCLLRYLKEPVDIESIMAGSRIKIEIEEFIWFTAAGIQSKEQLVNWIETFEQFAEEQREKAFRSEYAEDGCLLVSSKLYITEAEQEKPDWKGLRNLIEDVAERARNLKADLLWASLVNTLISILSALRELDEAVKIGKMVLASGTKDQRILFLIQQKIGRELIAGSRYQEGIKWLNKALALKTESYPEQHLFALLALSRSQSILDLKEAVDTSTKAVDYCFRHPEIHEILIIKALGENAIVLWKYEGLKSAFKPLELAIERLLSIQLLDDDLKGVFMVVGHVSGYLSSLAFSGQPPSTKTYGGIYAEPYPGLFMNYKPEVATLFDDSQICFILTQLAMYADAIGKFDSAMKWALRASDVAKSYGVTGTLVASGLIVLPYLIKNLRFGDAVSLALDTGAGLIGSKLMRSRRQTPGLLDNLAEHLGHKPNQYWIDSEEIAAKFSLLPIALELGRLYVNEDPNVQDYANEVSQICRQVGNNATDNDLWDDAAEIFKLTFSNSLNSNELVGRGNAYSKINKVSLHVLCYLGAVLHCQPQNAIQLQLKVLPCIVDLLSRNSRAMEQQVIAPYIKDYWKKTFNKARFNFSSPSVFESTLQEALDLPPDRVVKGVLKVVAQNLGVTLDDKMKVWLA